MRATLNLRGESGQVLVLAAVCLPIVLGFMGLALDFGMLLIARSQLQIAADSAALAGAAELNYSDYATAAATAAAQNGFTNGSNGVTVSVNPSGTANPSPMEGAYKGQPGYLEVVVSAKEPTYFMRIFNWTSILVNARAVAYLASNSNCIFTLGPSGAGIALSNNGQLTANCGILVDSNSSSAISVAGSANLTGSTVGVVGATSADNSGSKVSPKPVTGIAPFSDPLGFLQPPSYAASSCTADPLSHHGNGGSTYSVGPGSAYSTTQSGDLVCYSSLTLGVNADTVTVNPGIYVITGALTFASGSVLGGDGVTFYLTGNGSVNIGNGANFTFKAPTSGTYDGILFYQDRGDANAASIQGGANSTLQGILYFPAAPLSIGNGTTSTFSAPLVAYSISMVGGSKFIDNSYTAINATSPLTAPRIAE